MAYEQKPEIGEAMFKSIPTETTKSLKEAGLGDVKIFPPKEHGSYKGKVAFEDKNHLGQLIGKDQDKLVLHQKSNLALADGVAKTSNEKGLKDSSLQIYYGNKSEKAKTYFYSQSKEEQKIRERTDAKIEREASSKTLDGLTATAMSYAQKNFKTDAELGSFMRNFNKVVETYQQERTPPQQQQEQKTQATEQNKAKTPPTKEAKTRTKQQPQAEMER